MNNINKLRKAQLLIAQEIKRICDKHNINYFLDAGSMLGAVRHNGFIPWDDDMDFGMLKNDYEKFLKIAPKEIKSNFYIDNFYNNKDNALVFTKIRLIGTKYIENKGNANLEHNEIFVDIFPYYYISDNVFNRKLEGMIMAVLSQAIMSKSGYKVWKGDKIMKRLKFIPSDLIGICFSKKTLHNLIDNLYNKHSNTKNMCIHSGSCYKYWYFPKYIFEDFIDIEFENIIFKVPKEYELFLTRVYGDYMMIPPENQRITHQIKELDLGNYNFDDCIDD